MLAFAANSTGCEFYSAASFFILICTHVSRITSASARMRHSYSSTWRIMRQIDARGTRIDISESRERHDCARRTLLVIRSYVITLVLLVIDALMSCRSRDNLREARGSSAFPRARIALGRCGSGDERRRLYIKIAFKVERPRYRFLAFKGL